MQESDRNYNVDQPIAVPMEMVDALPVEPRDKNDWHVWELNTLINGKIRTLRAGFWHVPTKLLWVDPNICGDQGMELAIVDGVAIIMNEGGSRPLPILLAPAEWTREKFPDNSNWIGLLEARFHAGDIKIR